MILQALVEDEFCWKKKHCWRKKCTDIQHHGQFQLSWGNLFFPATKSSPWGLKSIFSIDCNGKRDLRKKSWQHISSYKQEWIFAPWRFYIYKKFLRAQRSHLYLHDSGTSRSANMESHLENPYSELLWSCRRTVLIYRLLNLVPVCIILA